MIRVISTSFSYVWDAQILARLGRVTEALALLEMLLPPVRQENNTGSQHHKNIIK